MIRSSDVERRLLRRGLGPRWSGGHPEGFARLVLDSRQVYDGDLFCAIAGGRVDAHDLLPMVAGAGAAAAVVERVIPEAGLPQLRVRDTRAAAAHLASLFHGDPGEALHLVGITGTNGKTTTAWLARCLLSDLGPTATLGTLGVVPPDGSLRPGTLTTPDPLALMGALAELRQEGAHAVAMEVSSHALAQQRVAALHFDVAVYTTFTREHLDYHPDMESYRAAKLRLLDLLRPGGTCVINADEPAWADLRGEEGEPLLPDGARRVTYGFSAEAEVRAESPTYGPARSAWRMVTPEGTARVDLPLPGEWNVQNALAAAAAALSVGMVPARIAELLSDVPPVPGRMEVLRRTPSLVLRDYAHTPDAFQRVLMTLRGLARGRLILVFGCGGDRDRGKRPEMGRIAGELADLTIVTTDNPRSEDPAEIARQVTAPMPSERRRIVLDRREAIARALEEAGPDDLVLLAGKGHETYQEVAGQKHPFDEAAIVRELTEADGMGAAGAEGVEA